MSRLVSSSSSAAISSSHQSDYHTAPQNLSPTPQLMRLGLSSHAEPDSAASREAWARFERGFRRQMAAPGPARTLDLLAALSHQTDFSLCCYCADEARCHRSLLRALLAARGARML